MMTEHTLIFILACLVVLLTLVLIRRISDDRKRLAVLRRLDLEEFAALLRANSRDGVIGQVAAKVSDLLKRSFGCERILFLRKKRGRLRYNFSHGLAKVERRDFRLPYTKDFGDCLRADYLPRCLFHLKPVLPTDTYTTLVELGFDTFFPIYWRDNLYGVYFIRSTLSTREHSFKSLVASLAQSLSAAYHVKWHESRNEDLQRKLSTAETEARRLQSPDRSAMMKLVRHRKPETIVIQIVEALVSEFQLERAACIHRWNDDALRVVTQGTSGAIVLPETLRLDSLISKLDDKKLMRLNDLKFTDESLNKAIEALINGGLDYITTYSLAAQREGVLAWSGGGNPSMVRDRLDSLRGHVGDLIDNAESFVRIEELSYTDNLTGLANQRYFLRRFDEEISRAQRYGRKLAFILFDLDELKAINDTCGHLAGDAILRQLGEILRNSIRSIDVVARYGGDEFCVIMPEADQETCRRFMKRLQNAISRNRFQIENADKPLRCTVSLGGAIFPDHGDDSRQMIHAADMALLKAKESGRNKSLVFEEDTP
jgi:diguanylate cyclase (GGDEF)-like protein